MLKKPKPVNNADQNNTVSFDKMEPTILPAFEKDLFSQLLGCGCRDRVFNIHNRHGRSQDHREREKEEAFRDFILLDSDVAPDDDGNRTVSARRKSQVKCPTPVLFHRIKHDKSILSLAVSGDCIFAGTQSGEILVFSLDTYEPLHTVQAHRWSVLSLHVSRDGSILFSSGGDAIVNAWSPTSMKRIYEIYSTYDVGDVFCVVYSPELQMIYCGAQNTSIQWYDLTRKYATARPNLSRHPSHRNHRFFDSTGPGGVKTPCPVDEKDSELRALGGEHLEIPNHNILQYAHFGYVYCMVLAHGAAKDAFGGETLISGGGDGNIKIWALSKTSEGARAIKEVAKLENGDESVLSLAIEETFLYSGRLEGGIDIWDLETRQLIRSVKAHTSDVLTLAVGDGLIFSGSASGLSKKFNRSFQCITKWGAHDGLTLASAFTSFHGRNLYITGGNDNCIAIWDLQECTLGQGATLEATNEVLLSSLSKFVSYKTVSSNPLYAEDCRRGASYLRSLFKAFGASTEMLTAADHLNPVVFAKIKPNSNCEGPRARILFYGHYDVVAAENQRQAWVNDPFVMEGRNGFLYGRGVSDNKGPVLSAAYAAMDLVKSQSLNCEIIFLIEGEEECGSRGFQQIVEENKKKIGPIDWILLANSYWLDDEVPCLTYGLRGVIQATVQVESDQPDLHSGVDGSSLLDEPLKDLVIILSALTGPQGKVNLPGFYEPILPLTPAEEERYSIIAETLVRRHPDLEDAEVLKESLMKRWREASFTIHRFQVSGPDNPTVIPRLAKVTISFRLVPNQSAAEVRKDLIAYLREKFDNLDSKNHLSIRIDHEAEPWLGDPDNEIFQTLERAVMKAWGPIGQPNRAPLSPTKSRRESHHSRRNSKPSPATSSTLAQGGDQPSSPNGFQNEMSANRNDCDLSGPAIRRPLYIREGGSIPAIRFLEKEFGAPAANLPCGQASDCAHLDNERIRISNLSRSRDIFRKVFESLPNRTALGSIVKNKSV